MHAPVLYSNIITLKEIYFGCSTHLECQTDVTEKTNTSTKISRRNEKRLREIKKRLVRNLIKILLLYLFYKPILKPA